MWRFWTLQIDPLLRAAAPKRIMEIGAENGFNTGRILAFCRETGAHTDIIDPAPTHDLLHSLSLFPGLSTFHQATSLEAIPKAEPPDVVLIDGDHNWWTVYSEFKALYEKADAAKTKPPLILCHDAAWPYGRRDMYYAPDRIDPEHRQPYAFKGIEHGKSELADSGGINIKHANALTEGGARNGVLTAIENFVAEWPRKIHLRVLPWFNGLAIVTPDERMTPELAHLIDGFFSSETLQASCVALEDWTIQLMRELQREQARLIKRTEALERARSLLTEQADHIRDLEARAGKGKPD